MASSSSQSNSQERQPDHDSPRQPASGLRLVPCPNKIRMTQAGPEVTMNMAVFRLKDVSKKKTKRNGSHQSKSRLHVR